MQIAPKNENSVLVSDNFKSVSFGIKQDGLAHIFGVLRNQLYSDKILAVIREYSANAVDANVEAGKEDQAIIVTVPNSFDPTFRVRDFGNGLNEEEIRDIYANYGESTKRNSNKLIGQLGLGSKSAFAYGDNFLINSYVNGKKLTYNAYIDPSQIGMIAKMNEEDTSEPNGVEICIPVKSKDIYSFVTKAKSFFKFWSSKVEVKGINASEFQLDTPTIEGTNWKFYHAKGNLTNTFRSVIVMGNVAYPFNDDLMAQEIENIFYQKFAVGGRLSLSYNFIFYVDIGTVEVSASREDLQYTDFTKKNLVSVLDTLFSELIEKINGKIENAADIFEAKRLYQATFCNLFSYSGFQFLGKKCNWKGFEVHEADIDFEFTPEEQVDKKNPASFSHYFKGRRSVKNTSFCATRTMSSSIEELVVIDDCDGKYLRKRVAELIINKKSYKGVTVVKVNDQQKWEEALAKRGLKDYVFKNLSELEAPVAIKRVSSNVKTPYVRNKKHLKHSFALDLNKTVKEKTNSNYWNPVVVDINSDSGVWMQINRFEYQSDPYITNKDLINEIVCLCSCLNISTPNFFGFKEVPTKIKNNPNFVEFKDWVYQTVLNKLNTDGNTEKFAYYLHISNALLNSSTHNMVRCFRNIPELNNNTEVQELILLCKELEKIQADKYFRDLRQVLVKTQCLQRIDSKISSNAKYPFYHALDKFMKKYPMLTYLNDSFFGYLNSPAFNNCIVSYIK